MPVGGDAQSSIDFVVCIQQCAYFCSWTGRLGSIVAVNLVKTSWIFWSESVVIFFIARKRTLCLILLIESVRSMAEIVMYSYRNLPVT